MTNSRSHEAAYPHIAARLYNVPLLLRGDTAELISSVLADRLGVEATVQLSLSENPIVKGRSVDDGEEGTPLPYQVSSGTALIPITGELVNRGSWIDAVSGLTSYKRAGSALHHAAANSRITGILLDIDSPGGEASGAMELGALVRKVAGIKPVTAFVDGQACSAAYAIASGASQVVAMPSATLGSIGVVLLHMDRSAQMAKDGLKPTLIQKGRFKTDGTSVKPLSQGAAGRLEGYLDVIYGLFVSSVAAHRAGLSEAAVRATEAGLFIGHVAVSAGLADKVGTIDDALATLPRNSQVRGMALSAPGPAAATTAPKGPTTSAFDTSSERARISAIVTHAEADGRGDLARHLALNTEMAPEAAIRALAAASKAVPASVSAASEDMLAKMRAFRAPNLGAPAADAAAAEAVARGEFGKSREQLEFEEGARTAARLLDKLNPQS